MLDQGWVLLYLIYDYKRENVSAKDFENVTRESIHRLWTSVLWWSKSYDVIWWGLITMQMMVEK